MPDQRITQLTEDTSPTLDDVIVTVHDVAGTPVNRRVTLANLLNALSIQIEPSEGGFANGDKTKLDSITQVAFPAADALMMYDHSAGANIFATSTPGITISETTISADVQSVAGETGEITASALRTALNVDVAILQFQLFGATEDTAVGDGAGGHIFNVPSDLNGATLVEAITWVATAGTTGTCTVQVHNITQGVDMLTTPPSIATSPATTSTGTVIDPSNDDVATGDKIRFDVETIHTGTAAQGLFIQTKWQL